MADKCLIIPVNGEFKAGKTVSIIFDYKMLISTKAAFSSAQILTVFYGNLKAYCLVGCFFKNLAIHSGMMKYALKLAH